MAGEAPDDAGALNGPRQQEIPWRELRRAGLRILAAFLAVSGMVLAFVALTALFLPPLGVDGTYVWTTGSRPEPRKRDTLTRGKEAFEATGRLGRFLWKSESLPAVVTTRRLGVKYPVIYAWGEDRWNTLLSSSEPWRYELRQRVIKLRNGEEHLIIFEEDHSDRMVTIWDMTAEDAPRPIFECGIEGPWGVTTPVVFDDGERPILALVSTVSTAGSYPPPDYTPTGIVTASYDPGRRRYEFFSASFPLRVAASARFLPATRACDWPFVSQVVVFLLMLLLSVALMALLLLVVGSLGSSVFLLLRRRRGEGPGRGDDLPLATGRA